MLDAGPEYGLRTTTAGSFDGVVVGYVVAPLLMDDTHATIFVLEAGDTDEGAT
jgi:hypothetical protein